MSISKQFQHFHQEDLGRKVDEIIDDINSKNIFNLGNCVELSDTLVALNMNNPGIYTGKIVDDEQFVIIMDDSSSGIAVYAGDIYIFDHAGTINDCIMAPLSLAFLYTPIVYSPCTNVNSKLLGSLSNGIENSTLHISGTFTPTATIAAGTKLFSTGETLSARMTDGSAINSGTAGSETFVGISIQTNGDVYCLGALTAGVTYSIAVTATL